MGPSEPTVPETGRTGDVTVAVSGVHVRYDVPSADAAARMPRPHRLARQLLGRQPRVVVRAVSDVSLVARAGESVGLVGLNGSGKSTLLRVIAGLEKPERGSVHASSAPVLLGVNAALLPELSGAQNVRLGCLAMGLTPDQTRAAMPEVVRLADIGSAIHLPMKTYSSGMGSRLRFAIAMAVHPDILLIDEALSTGDAAFKERSEQRMREMRQRAGTVFLVSHAAETVEKECDRAIWLDRGRLVLDGPAQEVARRYRWYAWNLAKGEKEKAAGLLEQAFLDGRDLAVHLVAAPSPGSAPRHARSRRRAPGGGVRASHREFEVSRAGGEQA